MKSFIAEEEIINPCRLKWLDPCAGGDKKNEMSYPIVANEFGVNMDTIDIREDSLAERKENYLETFKFDYDVVITNPPFHIALDIIKKALSDVRNERFVVMLLRLIFWGSKDRNEWLKENMPKYCYVHGYPRMGFIPEKPRATDSIEYAHFVW